jgi:tetratricopeptide (TPR) repeat protein
MARTRPIPISFVAAILLGIVLSPSAPAAEQSPWLEVHSTHFTVITDAGEKKGAEVALRFEQMRAVFATLLMKQRLNEPVPLTILAFKNDKDYYQTTPLRQGQPIRAPGFFLTGEDQNFIVLNLLEEEPWRAVAHDFAHLLLNYNYPEVQEWFDEGLVEYFSSIRVGDKKYEIGGDPELRSGAGDPPKSLTELLNSQAWLASPDLFKTKQDTTHTDGTRRTLFYAQAWMTMHYLLHEKKLPETGTYFDLVENQDVPVEEAIQKAYGVTSVQLDQAVKDYFHSLAPQLLALDAPGQPGSQSNAPQIFQFPEIVGPEDSAITSKFLPETDARAIVDEVRIRIPDRRDAALQDLQALATAPNPTPVWKAANKNKDDKSTLPVATAGNEIAHRVLAWDHLQHGEFDDAAEELGDAASLNRDDMWIRYYFSVLKYRMAQSKHGDILGLPNMMQDLRAVLEWYPEFAEADDLMARARMEGGGPVGAMQAERAAIQLSPRNQQYVYHLAEIYVADKKWEAARALLQRLIEQGKTGSSPQVAAAARERLEQLATEQKYGVSPATAAAASKLSKPSSPFDVLDQDAAKRAAAEQASQSGIADKRPTKFFQGRLVDVDCSQSPAAVLTVSSGGAVLKLRTADYKSLLLIGADNFSCEWNNRSVSVNYKSGGMSDGDLVSLEVR